MQSGIPLDLPVSSRYAYHLLDFWLVQLQLKTMRCVSLYENDGRCEVSNYRPVSLVVSFSKMFETVIQRRILNWNFMGLAVTIYTVSVLSG
jgi:hypothetical protein